MGNIVHAIVRGPGNYFDGFALHAPGQAVEVDEDFVSTEDYIEREIEVPLNPPIVQDGKLIRTAKEVVKIRTQFRPLGSVPQAEGGTTVADLAARDLARLNVTDFLKGGADEIVKSIVNGNVDEFLGVIEQAELARKGPARKEVRDAIAARLAAKSR